MGIYESKGMSDEWYTPKWLFDTLGCDFDLDVSCPQEGPRHTPCSNWFSSHALEKEWSGFVWMNPPFGNHKTKELWYGKFFDHKNGIALAPDRTSASWWQIAAKRSDGVLFIDGRVSFERSDGSVGGSPGTGTVLFAGGHNAADILKRSGLGFFARKEIE